MFQRFLISPSDWRYFDQNRVQDEKWKLLVQNIRDHFIRLSKRVTAPARFHLFFVTPPTVALALGAIIGRDIRCKAYQYFGPGGLVPVFDPERGGATDSYHRLQGLVGEYKEIRSVVTGDTSTKHVAIVLQFVGHPLSPVSGAITDAHHVLSVSHVTHSGHLPPTQDWMRIATELGSIILAQVSAEKTVHLFSGLPTALAFALGHVLGDHNPIRVYHYDKQQDKYIHVFFLNKLM